MTNTIKSYDAYLTFNTLSKEAFEQIKNLFKQQNLLVTLDNDALEFEFAGRDLSDYVVHLFEEVAKILVSANGEIRCEVDDDGDVDPTFLFYTIRDGALWKQRGKIVRSPELVKSEWQAPSG